MGWQKIDSVVITASGIVGMMLGSLLCEKILHIGRLKAALVANLLVIISTVPQMVLTVWSLALGRFMLGFAGGAFNVITSVYMCETIPASEVSKYGVSTNLGIVIGLLLTSLIQGFTLP
jgi:MFS family permease